MDDGRLAAMAQERQVAAGLMAARWGALEDLAIRVERTLDFARETVARSREIRRRIATRRAGAD